MLELLQVLKIMIEYGYTEEEIQDMFMEIEAKDGDLTLPALLDMLGIELGRGERGLQSLAAALPKFESALRTSLLRFSVEDFV